jgi:predicted Co/Zn/Cd cation transporter (cation efflux family)
MKCPYKSLFGTPGQGPHAKRIFGYAVVDTLATVLLALIIMLFTDYNFIVVFVSLFALGELLHYIFGVQTTVLTNLGIVACPDEKNDPIRPAYNIGIFE